MILAKTAVDQFVYSSLFTVPLICASFTCRTLGYRFGATRRLLGVGWYAREVVPVLVVNWAYWWPMGLLMYMLPPSMTFVYGAIGSAASATLLTAIAAQDAVDNVAAVVARDGEQSRSDWSKRERSFTSSRRDGR